MALSNLTLSLGGLVNASVKIENLIGKGTKPSGNYVDPESKERISRGGGGGNGGSSQVVGYPRADGTFFVPSEADLLKINGDKDHIVDLETFVPLGDVDPSYFDKTYALKPQPGSERAFWLMERTLRKLGRVAVGTACLDKDDAMMFLCPAFGTLLLRTGVYDEQIKYDLIEAARSSQVTDFTKAEIALAEQIMTKVFVKPFVAAEYPPERWHKLRALIEENGASAGGGAAKAATTAPEPPDLMAALQATVAAQSAKTNGKPKPKAKRTTRTKAGAR